MSKSGHIVPRTKESFYQFVSQKTILPYAESRLLLISLAEDELRTCVTSEVKIMHFRVHNVIEA